jgi:hypothetical protein
VEEAEILKSQSPSVLTEKRHYLLTFENFVTGCRGVR